MYFRSGTAISASVPLIGVKLCMTVELSSGRVFTPLMAISLGVSKCGRVAVRAVEDIAFGLDVFIDGGRSTFVSRVSTAMLMRDIDISILSVRPSVRPSVTFRYYIETALTCHHTFLSI